MDSLILEMVEKLTILKIKGENVVKSIKKPGKHGKEKEEHTKDHVEEYAKKHEKGNYPRRVWPTESEDHNKKGQKI